MEENKLKHLTEIEKRISIGWRLQKDLEWLIKQVKELLLEKENGNKS